MVTNFKLFEKLGINISVIKITQKIFVEFLNHYNKEKEFTDNIDSFDVNLSDVLEIKNNSIKILINYNESQSVLNYTENYITIGVISRTNKNELKNKEEIHSDIIHEVKHLIYFNDNKIFKKQFIKNFKNIFKIDLIDSFTRENSGNYKMNISVNNFLDHNTEFSKKYKELLVYLYYAHNDELDARLHEYYIRLQYSKNFKKTIDEYSKNKNSDLNSYQKMINFKLNINDMPEFEKNKILNYICDKKDIRKTEKYIQDQGKKFIDKLNKLSNDASI